MPPIPILISSARVLEKRRPAAGRTSSGINNQTIRAQCVPDESELTHWMLETNKLLPHDWMQEDSGNAVARNRRDGLCAESNRQSQNCDPHSKAPHQCPF